MCLHHNQTLFYCKKKVSLILLTIKKTTMSQNKIIWLIALVAGAIGILGYYDIVVIKGISKYSFEFLLAGYGVLILARLLKK